MIIGEIDTSDVLRYIKTSEIYWNKIPISNSLVFEYRLSSISSNVLGKVVGNSLDISNKEKLFRFLRYSSAIDEDKTDIVLKKFLLQFKDIIDPNLNFGKIAIWKVEPGGHLYQHCDNLLYHYFIDRYLININMYDYDLIINDINFSFKVNKIFKMPHFLPHSFKNNQDTTIYFLQLDVLKL